MASCKLIWFLFYVKSRRGISSLCCLFACVEHPVSPSRLDSVSGGRSSELSAASWDLSPELAPFGIACCLAALHRLSRCMILSKRKICVRHYPDTVTVSNDLLSGSGDLFQRIPRRLLPRLIMLSGHSVVPAYTVLAMASVIYRLFIAIPDDGPLQWHTPQHSQCFVQLPPVTFDIRGLELSRIYLVRPFVLIRRHLFHDDIGSE